MTDPVAMRHSTFEYTLTPPPGLQEKDQAVLTQHAELRPDPAQALPCIIFKIPKVLFKGCDTSQNEIDY